MGGLTGHVSVRDSNGQTQSFGPGDDVPDWAAKQVTNPRLWEDGEVPFPEKRSKGDRPAAAPPSAAPAEVSTQEIEDRVVERILDGVRELLAELVAVVDEADADADAGEGDSTPTSGPPPKAGRGSGEDKWRVYAAEQGVDVTAIEDRNEIIAFLESQGIPVE